MIIYDKEKYLLRAQKNSLAAWINNTLGSMEVTGSNVMQKLSDGVLLCKIANVIQRRMEECSTQRLITTLQNRGRQKLKFWENAGRETFFARDNAEVFLKWCKKFGVRESILFESDGLVLQSQPRTVLLCLLEVAHLAAKYGITPPPPVHAPTKSLSPLRVDSPDSDNESMSMQSTPSPESLITSHRVNSRTDSNPSPSSMSLGSPPLVRSSLRRSVTIPSATTPESPSRRRVVRCRSNLSEGGRVSRETYSMSSSTPISVRSYPSVISATTVCSRLRSSANSASRSTSNNSWADTSDAARKSAFSPLDKRVMEIAKYFCKDVTKIRRISEGLYSFGTKNLSLRMVRDNNVVVRLGGGWDTLEHFFLTTDFSFNPLNLLLTQKAGKRRKTRNLKSRSMTL